MAKSCESYVVTDVARLASCREVVVSSRGFGSCWVAACSSGGCSVVEGWRGLWVVAVGLSLKFRAGSSQRRSL